MLTCLATREERERAMPADPLIPDPLVTFTHAVTIRTRPSAVWPWLVQMGAGRAGWYAFDRLHNGGRPSAETLLPALLTLQPGDIVPARPGSRDAFTVARIAAQADLVLTAPAPDGRLRASWELMLDPGPGNRCRLVARLRLAPCWLEGARDPGVTRLPGLAEGLYRFLPGRSRPRLLPLTAVCDLIRQAGVLRGVRRRAERGLIPVPTTEAERRGVLDWLVPRAAVAEMRGAPPDCRPVPGGVGVTAARQAHPVADVGLLEPPPGAPASARPVTVGGPA